MEQLFTIKKLEDIIGNYLPIQFVKKFIENIQNQDKLIVIGPSGVGKTKCIELVCELYGYEVCKIDSDNCEDSKVFIDRLEKLHQWKTILQTFQNTHKKRILILDEMESLIQMDRNIPSYLIKFWNRTETHMPCIIIGQYQAEKKIGELKKMCQIIHFSRIQEKDMFLYLKDRIPKGKIKLADLMKTVEVANGSIYSAIQSILEYEHHFVKKKNNKKHSMIINNGQDDILKMEYIFSYLNHEAIDQVLHEDLWIHPLKVLENSSKVYTTEQYASFIPKYLIFEEWMYIQNQNEDLPAGYLTELIYQYNQQLYDYKKKSIGAIEMDFTKLLSYISTQKKLHRSIYNKCNKDLPIHEIGYYWIHTYLQHNKKSK
uniref:AAA+ ATPase domain-containing protein n=1 Tax=viral metagenome TaxID=1070528 RepID=A0A6C0CTA8_9ZZZZ